jgi:hypothetical protein
MVFRGGNFYACKMWFMRLGVGYFISLDSIPGVKSYFTYKSLSYLGDEIVT